MKELSVAQRKKLRALIPEIKNLDSAIKQLEGVREQKRKTAKRLVIAAGGSITVGEFDAVIETPSQWKGNPKNLYKKFGDQIWAFFLLNSTMWREAMDKDAFGPVGTISKRLARLVPQKPRLVIRRNNSGGANNEGKTAKKEAT